MPEENKAPESAQATEGVEDKGIPPDPVAELKDFIESRGIKSPDDFSDFLTGLETAETWKKKYGDSENKVGELRRELEGLRTQVMQNQYQYDDSNQVDLGSVIRKELKPVLGEFFSEMQQQQAEVARKYIHERNELARRPGWKDVQPYFDQAMQNPEVQIALQGGSLTQERLYNQINERVLMSKINSFVSNLPEGAVRPPPPNAETSDRVAQPIPEDEAKRQRMKKAVENQDVDALLKDLIGDDDPMVKF